MKAFRELLLVMALSVAVLTSSTCNREIPKGPDGEEDQSEILATVDGVPITIRDFEARINELSPYLRPRYKSLAKKKEFLQTMIRFEVLGNEAKRRGLENHPDVVRSMKQVMIQKLMQSEFDTKVTPDSVTAAEIKSYYDEHADEYARPERVRASAIIVEDRELAHRLVKLAKSNPGSTIKGFRALVAEYSGDEKSKRRGGDLQYIERDSKEVPKEVIDALFATTASGEVVGPVVVNDRYYILRQSGRRPAVNKSLEEVRPTIQNLLFREKRAQAQSDFLADLRANSSVEVDEKVLESLKIKTKPGKHPALGGATIDDHRDGKGSSGPHDHEAGAHDHGAGAHDHGAGAHDHGAGK